MKNIFLLFLSVIGLLIFLSCGQDSANEMEIEYDLSKQVKVNAYFYNTLGNGGVTSRATGKAWEKDDGIGLFMKKEGIDLTLNALAKNVKLTTDGTSRFTYLQDEKVYFPFNKEKVDFISYHPYRSSLDGLNYMIDVSNQTNLPAIDLLYSNNATGKNSDTQEVDLIFEHQLTKVVFTIVVNNTEKELSGLTASISNVNTKANFSLIDGTLTDKSEPNDVVLDVNSTGSVLQAILLPENNLTNKILVINIDGTTYTYPLISSSTITSFEKSKQCVYNITLNAGQGPVIEYVTATITDWITVTDDIEVTEDPSTTMPENPVPEPEEPITPIIPVGDGTQENPYNITQAFQLVEDRDKKIENYLPIVKDVWIKGYIVGYYSDVSFLQFVNSVDKASESSLALALTAEEADHHNIFGVNLLNSSNIKPINLRNKPAHFKKELLLKGNIRWFSNTPSGIIFGLDNLKTAIIDGVTYTQY